MNVVLCSSGKKRLGFIKAVHTHGLTGKVVCKAAQRHGFWMARNLELPKVIRAGTQTAPVEKSAPWIIRENDWQVRRQVP